MHIYHVSTHILVHTLPNTNCKFGFASYVVVLVYQLFWFHLLITVNNLNEWLSSLYTITLLDEAVSGSKLKLFDAYSCVECYQRAAAKFTTHITKYQLYTYMRQMPYLKVYLLLGVDLKNSGFFFMHFINISVCRGQSSIFS